MMPSLKYLLTRKLEATFDSVQLEHLGKLWLVVEECERHVIEYAMRRAGDNQVKAAKLLGINRTTLRTRLTIYATQDDKTPKPNNVLQLEKHRP